MHFKTTRLAEDTCPVCGRTINAATGVGHSYLPSAGDLTVCAYCVSVLTYDDNLKVKLMTKEEFEELPKETADDLRAAIVFLQSRLDKPHASLH